MRRDTIFRISSMTRPIAAAAASSRATSTATAGGSPCPWWPGATTWRGPSEGSAGRGLRGDRRLRSPRY